MLRKAALGYQLHGTGLLRSDPLLVPTGEGMQGRALAEELRSLYYFHGKTWGTRFHKIVIDTIYETDKTIAIEERLLVIFKKDPGRRWLHEDLAERLGCTRESVSRAMTRLETKRKIRREGKMARRCWPVDP